MMLSIGATFPTYTLLSVTSADSLEFKEIKQDDYQGQWKIYFFWPKDFTFVCPTEIVGFGKYHKEFIDHDTQFILTKY